MGSRIKFCSNKILMTWLLILISLTACLPANVGDPVIKPTDGSITEEAPILTTSISPTLMVNDGTTQAEVPTIINTIGSFTASAPVAMPTNTPTLTATPWPFPDLQMVAVNPCKLVGESGNERGYLECAVDIFTPFSSEPVFSLLQDGISYEYPTFSSDGRWLVYAERGEYVHVHLVDTLWQTAKPVTDEFENLTLAAFSWSADSRWLSFDYGVWTEGKLIGPTYIVNVENNELHEVGEDINALAWSPKQPTQFVFATGGQTQPFEGIYVASVGNLTHPEQLTSQTFEQGMYASSIAWHPDGSHLSVCMGSTGNDGFSVWLFDFSSHTWQQKIERVDAYNCSLSWSPNGDWFVINTQNQISIYEVETWEEFRTISWPDAALYGINWIGDNSFSYYRYYLQPPSRRMQPVLMVTVADIAGAFEVLWTASYDTEYVDILALSWLTNTPFR